MIPIEQACFWIAGLPRRELTRLSAPTKADVVIIGGGFTGFWTALFLKELDPTLDVALIEQGVAAYGASGRNAGMLSETVDHSHALAIQHFGAAEAAKLALLGKQNADELIAFIRDRGIACDYEPSGRLKVALTERHVEDAKRILEVAEALGLSSFRLLNREQTQDEVHCPLFLGAVEVSGGGILNPAKLTDGLRREAERLGVRVFERTTVESIDEQGAAVVVRANGTTLKAPRAVLATSAYTHHLVPGVRHRFIPLYDYIVVSEPLTAEQWALIGWKKHQGITDGRNFFNYYRPTADGRVLWGTSAAAYYAGNRVDPSCDHSLPHYAALKASWIRHFPELAGLQWPFAWGGAICSTTRLTPFFGSALRGKACYGLGYTGHGIATTRIAGRILAHMALDRTTDLLDLSLVKKPPFPYPPEPIRAWAVSAVTASLLKVDAGESPNLLLRMLDAMGLGFSS